MALVAPPDFEAAVAGGLGITGYDAGSLSITVVAAADAGPETTVRFTVAYQIETAQLLTLFGQFLTPPTS